MQKGMVVYSKAGHDKGSFYMLTDIKTAQSVFIADGKRRKLLNPKLKNVKHLAKTNTVFNLLDITSDKKLRAMLNALNSKIGFVTTEMEGD